MLPPLPNLDDYQISKNGFLPAEPPLERLSDPYYGAWEDVVSDLRSLIADKRIRETVEELPILSTSRLRFEAEWRRAYVVLGFISNSYIWGLEKAKDVCLPLPQSCANRLLTGQQRLPKCIAIPFLEVSEHLEVPPVITYAACCLWNFQPIHAKGPIDMVENLTTLNTFTGSMDESWFYLVSVAIEARGAPTIHLMMEAIRAARQNDSGMVSGCLTLFAERILDLRELLGRMYDHCTPRAFYFQIRPFLAGSKNMAEAGLPNGVLFEDGSGQEEYRQYAGGSNAQSSLIQFFDITLGVQHRPTGVKKDPSEAKIDGHPPLAKHNFIEVSTSPCGVVLFRQGW